MQQRKGSNVVQDLLWSILEALRLEKAFIALG